MRLDIILQCVKVLQNVFSSANANYARLLAESIFKEWDGYTVHKGEYGEAEVMQYFNTFRSKFNLIIYKEISKIDNLMLCQYSNMLP